MKHEHESKGTITDACSRIQPPEIKKNERWGEKGHLTPLYLVSILPSLPSLHVREKQLESIAKSSHVGIRVTLKLIALRDDLDRPVLQLSVRAGLKTQVEIPRVFWIDTKCVSRAFWIGLGIRC